MSAKSSSRLTNLAQVRRDRDVQLIIDEKTVVDDGLRLLQAFQKIRNGADRRVVIAVAERLAAKGK